MFKASIYHPSHRRPEPVKDLMSLVFNKKDVTANYLQKLQRERVRAEHAHYYGGVERFPMTIRSIGAKDKPNLQEQDKVSVRPVVFHREHIHAGERKPVEVFRHKKVRRKPKKKDIQDEEGKLKLLDDFDDTTSQFSEGVSALIVAGFQTNTQSETPLAEIAKSRLSSALRNDEDAEDKDNASTEGTAKIGENADNGQFQGKEDQGALPSTDFVLPPFDELSPRFEKVEFLQPDVLNQDNNDSESVFSKAPSLKPIAQPWYRSIQAEAALIKEIKYHQDVRRKEYNKFIDAQFVRGIQVRRPQKLPALRKTLNSYLNPKRKISEENKRLKAVQKVTLKPVHEGGQTDLKTGDKIHTDATHQRMQPARHMNTRNKLGLAHPDNGLYHTQHTKIRSKGINVDIMNQSLNMSKKIAIVNVRRGSKPSTLEFESASLQSHTKDIPNTQNTTHSTENITINQTMQDSSGTKDDQDHQEIYIPSIMDSADQTNKTDADNPCSDTDTDNIPQGIAKQDTHFLTIPEAQEMQIVSIGATNAMLFQGHNVPEIVMIPPTPLPPQGATPEATMV